MATSGPVTAIECKNTLLRSEDEGLELVGLDLEIIIAVAMPDAVLIADRSRAQNMKLAADALNQKCPLGTVLPARSPPPGGSSTAW